MSKKAIRTSIFVLLAIFGLSSGQAVYAGDGEITVIKIVDGGAAVPNDFNLTLNGEAVLSGVMEDGFKAGTSNMLNETQLTGYTVTSIVASGIVDGNDKADTPPPTCPTALGGPVIINDKKDEITCTITNTFGATLSLTKAFTGNSSHASATDLEAYDAAGEVLRYSYTVTNTGSISVLGPILIDDDLATTNCPDVSTVGPTFDDTLDVGESIVCTGSYTTREADLVAGEVTNTASVTGNTLSLPAAETVYRSPLGIEVTGSSVGPTGFVAAGETLSYTYTVTNYSAGSVPGPVVIVDDIATVSPCPALTTVGNNDGNLDTGESITCSGTYTVLPADMDARSVTNNAYASLDGGGSMTATHATTLYSADLDLPGALANPEALPVGSLIIPMDSRLQSNGVAFNLKSYGLVNRLLQNYIPVKWAIRHDKVKVRGTAETGSLADGTLLVDTTADFGALGVEVGDLVTNADDDFATGVITAMGPADTLTIDPLGSGLNWADGDEYMIDGHDFEATAKSVVPSCAPAVDPAPPVCTTSELDSAALESFAGGPFIVSAEHATQALEIMDDFINDTVDDDNLNGLIVPLGGPVAVYETTVAIDASPGVDIRYTLTHKPFVAISDVNTDIHSDIMTNAGIPGSENCTAAGQVGHDAGSCNWNMVDPLDLLNLECATIHLEPHRGDPDDPEMSLIVDQVRDFVQNGANFAAQCHAVEYFENLDERLNGADETTTGQFLTTNGLIKSETDEFLVFPNAPLAFSQITGPLNGAQGGSVPAWSVADGSGLPGGSYPPHGHVHAQGFGADEDDHKAAATKLLLGHYSGGNIFYLGGHEHKDSDLNSVNGQRMILNTLFVPADRPQECGLNFTQSLTIVKEVINDNGGDDVIGDFTITTDAGALTFDAGVTVGSTTTYTSTPLVVDADTPYSLVETDHPDYSESSWSCDNGDGGAFGAGSVTLAAGENVICTITNDDLAPSLTIEKTITSDNGGTATLDDFDVSVDAAEVSWADDTSTTFGSVLVTTMAGTYTLSEADFAGYTEGSWSCSDGDGAVAVTNSGLFSGADVTVALGKDVTCSITNNDDAPSLTVAKTITSDNGGTATLADFDVSVDAVEVSWSDDTSTTGGSELVTTTAGTYTLSEADFAGYTAGSWSCSDGDGAVAVTNSGLFSGADVTVALGKDVTCSITNNDIAPGLTIVKNIASDNGGTATLDDFDVKVNGTEVAWTDKTHTSYGLKAVTNTAGTYTLSELDITGYTPGSWSCSDGDGAVAVTNSGLFSGANVTLALEQQITCTITNTDDAPSLTIVKTITSDNGGTATLDDFDVSVDAVEVAWADNTSTSGGSKLVTDQAGTYTLSEADFLGYTEGSWSCSDGDGAVAVTNSGLFSGADVTVALGKDVTCSITNNDDAPSLTVAKTITSDNGGTATLADFDVSVDAVEVSWSDDTSTTGGSELVTTTAGTYTLSEADFAGYTAGSWSCSDGDGAVAVTNGGLFSGADVTVALGKDVTCSITNTDDAPSLTVAKVITSDDSGTATLDDFDVSVDAVEVAWTTPTSTTGASKLVTDQAGTYTLSEANLPDYTEGSWSCSDADGVVAVTNGGLFSGADVTVTLGQDVICTITNDDNPPSINLAKTALPAVHVSGDVWEVVYTVTATNTADGPGVYDIIDTLSPGTGITLVLDASYPAIAYGGGETQTGTLTTPPLANGGTWVTAEELASGASETWTITARFTLDAGYLVENQDAANCIFEVEETGTGFYNLVEGSLTDTDLTDNDACVEVPFGRIEVELRLNPPTPDTFIFFDALADSLGHGDVIGRDVIPGTYQTRTPKSAIDLGEWIVSSFYCNDSDSVTNTAGTDVTATFNVDQDETVRCVLILAQPADIPVPVNNPLALLLMTLMMLATGWYFRPATMRKQ